MARGSGSEAERVVDAYTHDEFKRVNNPGAGMAQYDTEQSEPGRYAYDPHFDPMLVWSGKAEHDEVEVPTTSIHIHESVKPSKIISRVQRHTSRDNPLQPALFGMTAREETELRNQAIEFYEHGVAWTNRLIAGDSLGVMNSLIQKEGMAGQVQMVYIDPPYGIGFKSNFQPLVNTPNVVEGKDDSIDSSPVQLTAFRDTWEMGIHSYLTYLRDRLKLAHELLAETGSVFVQISNANVHHVRELCDEVFGPDNFMSQVSYATTTGAGSPNALTSMPSVTNYLVWYTKDKEKATYHQLYKEKEFGGEGASSYGRIELQDGSRMSISQWEKTNNTVFNYKNRPLGSRVYAVGDLRSQSASNATSFDFEYKGKTYSPGKGYWKTNETGMRNLAAANRIDNTPSSIGYVRYFEDFPYYPITNIWTDTVSSFMSNKVYVVQTNVRIIERCLLMTTDPGDLVLDPTCGSGTTAWAAEKWGRRWITIDTSRVAIEVAKKRLMTSTFDYYELLHPSQGVDSGLVLDTADHITLRSIARGEDPESEVLYDKPHIDKTRVRVAGPFTIEAPPSPVVISPTDEKAGNYGDSKQGEWMEELRANGILDRQGHRIRLSRLDMLEGTTYLAAEGETDEATPRSIVVCFGSDTKPMDRRVVDLAADEAATFKPRPDLIIIAAFQFDPEATDLIANLHLPRTELVAVQMNPDLLTADLRKKQRNGQGFTIIGQPDIKLEPVKSRNGQWRVNVAGFDYYDVRKGELTSGSAKDIAMWELDEDYDGLVFEPEQVFFPDRRNGWQDLAKTLRAEVDPTLIKAYSGTTSLPFTAAKGTRCAVKIIDNRGIESTAVLTIPMD